MTRFKDLIKDIEEAESWEQGTSTEALDLTHINDLAILGVGCTDDYCPSREACGEHRCICIREAFPTPEHYHLYLTIREQYKGIVALGLATRANKEKEEGDKEWTEH